MKDVKGLERKIRKSIKQWANLNGYGFSGDHIVRLVRKHYGLTFTWEQALLFSEGTKSLQQILDEQREHNIGIAIKLGLLALAAAGVWFLYVNAPRQSATSQDSASQRPTSKTAQYCKYPGCTEPPSGFWNEGTGYCNRHAQQLRDEQKLLDKMQKQGF